MSEKARGRKRRPATAAERQERYREEIRRGRPRPVPGLRRRSPSLIERVTRLLQR